MSGNRVIFRISVVFAVLFVAGCSSPNVAWYEKPEDALVRNQRITLEKMNAAKSSNFSAEGDVDAVVSALDLHLRTISGGALSVRLDLSLLYEFSAADNWVRRNSRVELVDASIQQIVAAVAREYDANVFFSDSCAYFVPSIMANFYAVANRRFSPVFDRNHAASYRNVIAYINHVVPNNVFQLVVDKGVEHSHLFDDRGFSTSELRSLNFIDAIRIISGDLGLQAQFVGGSRLIISEPLAPTKAR